MKESPLTLATRMANKCCELFRRAGHPGWALFAEIASDAVATAKAVAQEAQAADADACQMIDEVLADGIVTKAEIARLREARRHVARSQALDAHLAGVVV